MCEVCAEIGVGWLHDENEARKARLTEVEAALPKLHVLIAEIGRCIHDDNLMAAHRKLRAIDELLKDTNTPPQEPIRRIDTGQRTGVQRESVLPARDEQL